jgi:hypothetical protein
MTTAVMSDRSRRQKLITLPLLYTAPSSKVHHSPVVHCAVVEREPPHERSLLLLELERQREQELHREANLWKRERSQLFNERVRQQQIQRICDYEAGAPGLKLRGDSAHREGRRAPVRKTIGSRLVTTSQIFAPITLAETV